MGIIATRLNTVCAVALLGGAYAADIAAAELQRGALLFQTCSACHSVLGDGVGPDLAGIYGKKAASGPDFNYSNAMRASGLVWDEPTLSAFISDPQALVKGTTMAFPGYPKAADVAAVVSYLKALK